MRLENEPDLQQATLTASLPVRSQTSLAKHVSTLLDGANERVFDMTARPLRRLFREFFLTRSLPDDPESVVRDTNEQNKQILESISSADRISLQEGKLTFKFASGQSRAAIYFSEDGSVNNITLFGEYGSEISADIPSGSKTTAAILKRAIRNIRSFGVDVSTEIKTG